MPLTELLSPSILWSRAEILAQPCPVPRQPGVYAWYFKQIPPLVPVADCVTWQGMTLLYVGISPAEPAHGSEKVSRQTLYNRIRYHYRGNAYGSTLRLTLGCLLMEQLGIRPQRAGSRSKITFGDGENLLSQWMAENAFVTWMVDDQPWIMEDRLIHRLSLPLNLKGNQAHPFYPILTARRKLCRGLSTTF